MKDLIIYIDEKASDLDKQLVRDNMFLAKDRPPTWWNKKAAKARVCPSLIDLLGNTLIVTAPFDMLLEYLEGGAIHIQTPLEARGGSGDNDTCIRLSYNDEEESGDLYKFLGAVNLKLHWPQVTLTNDTESTVQTIQMPPTFFKEDIFSNRFTTAVGEVLFPPKFRIELINMLFIPKKSTSSRVVIRKGEPLSGFYLPDKVSNLRYVTGPLRPRMFSKLRPGGDYADTEKAEGCPFRYSEM